MAADAPAAVSHQSARTGLGTVSFRFTPLGNSSGWRVDDVYLDPYKSA